MSNEADDEAQGLLPLIRFLLQWSRRLAAISYRHERHTDSTTWNDVVFGAGGPLDETRAREIAARMLDPTVKLNPYHVFLYAFWTICQVPEQKYRNLLNEHRTRYYKKVFDSAADIDLVLPEAPLDASDSTAAFDDYVSRYRAFVLRTRQRLLNAVDLRTGLGYRFPDYRVLVEEDRTNAEMPIHVAIFHQKPDDDGEYLLSEAERDEVRAFLRQTTSAYAAIQPAFEHTYISVDVDVEEWAPGVDRPAARKALESAFKDWAWQRLQLQAWDREALETSIHAFLYTQKSLKGFSIALDDPEKLGLPKINIIQSSSRQA